MVRAGTTLSFPLTLSEPVNVVGTPFLTLDVGGTARQATFASGSGTSVLTFTYTAQPGDFDLDGITVASPLVLNGGSLKDLAGNDLTTLTFSAPDTTGVRVDYPAVALDFIANDYLLSGTHYASWGSFLTAAGGSFSRPSAATYFDATGTMQTAASGVSRFDHDPATLAAKGLLIEESRSNQIRNSQAAGAVVGLPGTFPTNWQNGVLAGNGINYQVVAIGTTNGLSTMDVRFYGTPTNTTPAIYFDGIVIPALIGQTWTISAFIQQIAGSTSGLNSINLRMVERNSGGAIVLTRDTPVVVPATGPVSHNRLSATATLTGATTAYLHPGLLFSVNVGIPIDITLRIACPQLEQGYFASSYIPTTTGAVTRSPDLVTLPLGAWFALNTSTLMISGDIAGQASGGTFQLGLGSNGANYFGFPYVNSTTILASSYYRSAGAGPIIGGAALAAGVPYKAAYAYSVADGTSSYSKNGVLSGTGSGIAALVAPTTLHIGASPFNLTTPASGHVRSLRYYPARLIDAQLLLLTQ